MTCRRTCAQGSSFAVSLKTSTSTTNAKARIDREHKQALDRLQQRYDDDAAKRDERYSDEEDKAQKQLKRDLARADQEAKKRLEDLDKREQAQKAAEQRSDGREEAHRRLADTRAQQDLATADRRDIQQRNLQAARDQDDWNTARKRAEKALQADIDNIATKKDKDIRASQEKEAAAITASNDALIEKQRQIDGQRDTDFAKFSEDLAKRFR